MQQPIVGFHQDEKDDWVADLACGHTQHVRHQPPWVNRPWVITDAGRRRFLGHLLWCKTCEEPDPDRATERPELATCELCGREADDMTMHHLVPHRRHRPQKTHNGSTRDEVKSRRVHLCRPCHQEVHLMTDKDAELYF